MLKSLLESGLRAQTLLGVSLLALPLDGGATVISGSSAAYGLEMGISAQLQVSATANVTGVGAVTTNSSPVSASVNVPDAPAGASGTAPAPYTENRSTASVTAGTTLSATPVLNGVSIPGPRLLDLSTQAVNGAAKSDVDGTAGTHAATGSGSVVSTATGTPGLDLLLPGGLHITAQVIEASATVSGDYGAFAVDAFSHLNDLHISVGGVDLSLPVEAQGDATLGAGTSLDLSSLLAAQGLSNVSLILNEQTVTGNGVDNRTVAVNALHLQYSGFSGSGLDVGTFSIPFLNALGLPVSLPVSVHSSVDGLTGDIIIGHAEAGLQAEPNPTPAPEPSILLSFGAGLLAMARTRRGTAFFGPMPNRTV